MPSQDTQFQPGGHRGREFQPGNPHRWPRGVTGSPGGISTIRRRFHEAYAEALAGGGEETELRERAQELADLAWTAARKGESWAYGEIRGQLAPLVAAAQIKITHEVGDDGFDYSKLSDEQLRQLRDILEGSRIVDIVAESETRQLESGDSAPEPA